MDKVMTKKIATIEEQCKIAFESSSVISRLSKDEKNLLLKDIAAGLVNDTDIIIKSNQADIKNGKNNGLSSALIDRLHLDENRIKNIAESIIEISKLDDPIGTKLEEWKRPNGLKIKKIRVPLGVIGMIYEARPNVTADAIAIGIKTGNSMVLRGSASAYESNLAISTSIKKTIQSHTINSDFIQLLEDTSRDGVKEFVQMNQYLNLIIPRGGAGLIQNVVHSATVPTIETGVGNCHLYIDKDANLTQALDIADNAKTHRPSVCNACESIIVHKQISNEFLQELNNRFLEKNVEIRGCEKTLKILDKSIPANESDWNTEYLDLIISIKIVDSLDEAIHHIKKYGTLHTEAIVSQNANTIEIFTQNVDASTIIVNASTRFTDGGEFGFGAEIGISTQKLHARGPMGIKELTSYKYIVEGTGQIRN